jgi:hypothetical protein
MEIDRLKVLLRESLSMFETEIVEDTITEADFLKKAREKIKKDREDKEKNGEDDEDTNKNGEDAVSQGEQDDLNKLSKSIYGLGIGGELSRCVFGKGDKNRALQSKLRKYMKDDPYAEKGHPDVGKTPKSIARKVIGCVTKIRAKLAKV